MDVAEKIVATGASILGLSVSVWNAAASATHSPSSTPWTMFDLIRSGRWYPTCVTLPDGRVFIISGGMSGPIGGQPVNATIQVYDPLTNDLMPLLDVPNPFGTPGTYVEYSAGYLPIAASDQTAVDLYPFCFVVYNYVIVHSRNVTRFYNWASDSWSPLERVSTYEHSRTYPGQGTAVLLPLDYRNDFLPELMMIGGGGGTGKGDLPGEMNPFTPATATTERMTFGGETETAWKKSAPMEFPRVLCDAVLLPDGTVFVTGGSSTGASDEGPNPVMPPELYFPASNAWRTLSPMRVPRLYHSMALLLPDGRVMTGGKDHEFQSQGFKYPETRLELYSPPYLFRGNSTRMPRPPRG